MTRIVVQNLQPNRLYAMRVRARDGNIVSEWSPLQQFMTINDDSPPTVPTGFTWVSVGNSFHGEWDAVTQNMSGEEIFIVRYELELVADTVAKIVSVTPTTDDKVTYDLSFENNKALWGEPGEPVISARVRAVDNRDLKSDWSSPVVATNAVPVGPTTLTATPATDQIYLSWDASASTDVVKYNLYVGSTAGFTPSLANRIFSGDALNFTYTTATYSLQYFKVFAVDEFLQNSSTFASASATPGSPFGGDGTPPAVPTGLTATITANPNGIGATAAVSWSAVADTDVAGYVVRYRKNGTSDAYVSRTFSDDVTSGIVELAQAYVNYDFQVRSFDGASNYSAWSSVYTATASGAGTPATPTGLTATATGDSITYNWTGTADTNLKTYELQFSTSNTFSSGNTTFATGTATTVTVSGLVPNTHYYARVRAVNVAGTAGSYTSTNDTNTLFQSGTWAATGPITLGPDANIIMNGGYIKSNTYPYTVANPAATAGFYLGNDGLVIASGAVKADAIATGNLSAAQISMIDDATIQSVNYVPGVSGWAINGDQQGISINEGTIQAPALVIQNSANIVPPQWADFEASASTYASMAVTNATVAQVSVSPKFNTYALQVTRGASATGFSVYLGTSTTDYNLPVQGSSTYIISAYVRNRSAVSTTFRPQIKWSTGAVDNGSYVTPTTSSSTWQRISFAAQAPSGAIGAVLIFDASTNTSGAQFEIDGVQVEEKIAGSNTPSAYKPPGTTTIDGGIIRTGAITSNNFDDDTDQAMWSINLNGAATFTALRVLGNTVIGESPDDTATMLQSSNYIPGELGWRLRADGLAEFRQVVAGSMNPDVLGSGILDTNTTIELQGALEAYGYNDGVRNGVIVGLSSAGFYSKGLDASGVQTTFIDFPTATGRPNIISGTLNAVSIDVSNSASFRQVIGSGIPAMTLHVNSDFFMASVTPPPNNAPTVTVDWENTQLSLDPSLAYRGWTRSTADNNFYAVGTKRAVHPGVGDGAWIFFYLRKFDGTTGAFISETKVAEHFLDDNGYVSTWRNGTYTNYGVTYIPNLIGGSTGAFVILFRASVEQWNMAGGGSGVYVGTVDKVYSIVVNPTSSGTYGSTASNTVYASPGSASDFSVARDYTDGTRLVVGYKSGSNHYAQFFTYPSNTMTAGTLNDLGTSMGSAMLWGYGPFDQGGTNYFVAADNSQSSAAAAGIGLKSVNWFASSATTTNVASIRFPVANMVDSLGGSWNFTTSKFENLAADGRRYIYYGGSNTFTTGTLKEFWYWSYSWWDSTGTNRETTNSPMTAVTMYKRARVSVTHPIIPYISGQTDTPNRSRIYRSTTQAAVGSFPSTGTFSQIGYVEQPGQTWQMTGSTLSLGGGYGSGGSAFSVGTASKIYSDGGIEINADGSVSSLSTKELTMIGEIRMWVLSTAPNSNWLMCNGGTFDSTLYPELAAKLGDTFGVHSGTTYYLPDFRARFPFGAGTNYTTASRDAIAETSRSISHSHGLGGHTHTVFLPNHNHSIGAQAGNGALTAASGGGQGNLTRYGDYNNHAHGGGTGNTSGFTSTTDGPSAGSDAASLPYQAIYFIIRAK